MSNLSTSWEDEPAQINQHSPTEGFMRTISLLKPLQGVKSKRHRPRPSLDEVIQQVSGPSHRAPASAMDSSTIRIPDVVTQKYAEPEPESNREQAAAIALSAPVTTAKDSNSPRDHASGLVNAHSAAVVVQDAPSAQPKKRKRVKKETMNENPDKSIAATSSNVVYQDLKSKGGTKSNKGAEHLRRRISRARNERWREANGFRRKGRKAAQYRREQISREMAHEKNLLEALSEANIIEMFSVGVDKAMIIKLTEGGSVPKQAVGEESGDRSDFNRGKEELQDFLRNEFKYDEFREGQYEAISSVLSGERSLIVLPTGAGKSLCYQFPSVFLRKIFNRQYLTIVVSPLIALMADQLKLLPACCRGAAIHSNLSATQTFLVFSAIQAGLIDVLFLAPERLLMYSMQEVLQSVPVLLVALDEAHCLSEWSHSFRPAYLAVPKVIDVEIKPISLLALTATATIQTVDSLRSVLSLSNVVRTDGINSGEPGQGGQVQRKNLQLFAKRSPNPVMDLLEFLTRPEMKGVGPVIVYVNYKWQTENVSQVLRERGLGTAEGYHGGLSGSERKEIHEKFIHNQLRFVVATVAFGMGIDKRNVRAVVHLTIPKSIENYVQETGRCSRDNQIGRCRCYFNADDYARIRNKMVSDSLKKDGVDFLLNFIQTEISSKIEGKLLFVPEDIQPHVSKQHMSLLLSLVEAKGLGTVHQGFPRCIKLRFFSNSFQELSTIDPFIDLLFHSPFNSSSANATVSESGGVASIDLLTAMGKSYLSPPQFMHKLAVAARAQKFTVAKSEWGHIFSPFPELNKLLLDVDLSDGIYNTAIANHRLELNRLDAAFALVSRIAAESIDDETIGHSLIQTYFEAEQRLDTGDDLVQSVLEAAPLAVARSILREIEDIRNSH